MKPLLALLLLSGPTAHAQLGKTYLELVQKYGRAKTDKVGKFVKGSKPLIPKEVSKSAEVSWDHDGFQIQAAWMAPHGAKGPADYVKITNPKGFLTDPQRKAIFEANGGETNWKMATTEDLNRLAKENTIEVELTNFISPAIVQAYYLRTDGALANPTSPSISLTLKSPRLVNAETKQMAQQKAEREKIPNL